MDLFTLLLRVIAFPSSQVAAYIWGSIHIDYTYTKDWKPFHFYSVAS